MDLADMSLHAGIVRGERIHMECATPEETTMTWAQFFLTTEQAKGDCERCGHPLSAPRPSTQAFAFADAMSALCKYPMPPTDTKDSGDEQEGSEG